jgi:hypothetical protein
MLRNGSTLPRVGATRKEKKTYTEVDVMGEMGSGHGTSFGKPNWTSLGISGLGVQRSTAGHQMGVRVRTGFKRTRAETNGKLL